MNYLQSCEHDYNFKNQQIYHSTIFHRYGSFVFLRIYIYNKCLWLYPISDDNLCHVFIVLNNIQYYPVNKYINLQHYLWGHEGGVSIGEFNSKKDNELTSPWQLLYLSHCPGAGQLMNMRWSRPEKQTRSETFSVCPKHWHLVSLAWQ